MIRLQSVHDLNDRYDLVVIGAGPAGMAAVMEAARNGVRTLVLDENPSYGGQIYRGIASTTKKRLGILGKDYAHGAGLAQEFTASDAGYLAKATVWQLSPEREIGVSCDGRSRLIMADRILVATGAMERPFPVEGWTLPGVMTAGAAQILLKASGAVLGPKVVLAGTGPLLWLIASQYIKANVPLAAILDTTPRANFLAAIPSLPSFIASPYFAKGVGLLAKVRGSVRVHTNVGRVVAEGDRRLERVRFFTGDRENVLEADHLLLHQGVIPEVSLLRSAGCETTWDDGQICWRPKANSAGETSVPGVYVAGDCHAVYGAEAAELAGRRIALEVARSLDRIQGTPFAGRCAEIERRRAPYMRGRAFLDRMFRPRPSHLVPADNAIACRCEEVLAKTVRDTAARLKVQGPNQLKAFLRCGMGPCQGRQCGPGIAAIIAGIRGVPAGDIGALRLRPPVKPINLGQIADLCAAPVKGAEKN